MANCRQCGKELPKVWSTDICLECSRENLRKIFKENPEAKRAFRESIEEMRKPENVRKMADNTVSFLQSIQLIQKKSR